MSMKLNNEFFRKLGVAMMEEAPKIKDDETCNSFARVGELITHLGTAFNPPNISKVSEEDRKVVVKAWHYFQKKGINI